MAGERLIAATFEPSGRCRLCGAYVNRRKGARLAHASEHLRHAQKARYFDRDQKDNPHMGRKP